MAQSPATEATAVRSASELPLRTVRDPLRSRDTVFGRIPLMDPRPEVPGARFAPRAYRGECVPFEVTAFREGHDLIGVNLRLYAPDGSQSLHRMSLIREGLDRWRTEVVPLAEGRWAFRFEAFADDAASWLRVARTKLAAGVDVAIVCETGARLLHRAASERDRPPEDRRVLADAASRLRAYAADAERALLVAQDRAVAAAFGTRPLRSLDTVGERLPLEVERERAGVGAWYELFPRSEGAVRGTDGRVVSGTFATAQRRLAGVAGMGFDVVYLPPIHPIGRTHRKGPNNSGEASSGDPGSPWAIGSEAGGHDAVHPDLGTIADFAAFVAAARREGLEVALDLALQASPDHPWVREHPEWFTTLPDGTIAYAENPPKKYQDIYPLNFDQDPEGLRAEVLRIVRFWIDQGVAIFRVDNPHTKPLRFWEWLIRTVREDRPEVVFLAEAFTRPAPLEALARAGFQQSYTYFTWRTTKPELEEFLLCMSGRTADYVRPNLFVNTPDILTEYLQFGGRPAYRIRAAIAATASPSYGVYAGYELYENVARPGSEENIDNEKYEYKPRDWEGAEARGDSLAPYLRRLNRIRREHPALRQLRNLTVHWSDDDAILVYVKHLPAALSETGEDDTVIVVANLDPHSVRETTVHLDTSVWGAAPGSRFPVTDLITGQRWDWGEHNYVRLDAFTEPVHVLHVGGTT